MELRFCPFLRSYYNIREIFMKIPSSRKLSFRCTNSHVHKVSTTLNFLLAKNRLWRHAFNETTRWTSLIRPEHPITNSKVKPMKSLLFLVSKGLMFLLIFSFKVVKDGSDTEVLRVRGDLINRTEDWTYRRDTPWPQYDTVRVPNVGSNVWLDTFTWRL